MPQLPPQVPQTRRSTYRPMKLMNGDFLTQLKRPLCSELGPEIKGTNKGKLAQCKHTVGLWFKDQTFSLRKLDKAEDAVYETFLQVHKEKHKRKKEAYKKKQEEARQLADNARKRALDNIDLLVSSDLKLPAISVKPSVTKVIEVVKVEHAEDDKKHRKREEKDLKDMVKGSSSTLCEGKGSLTATTATCLKEEVSDEQQSDQQPEETSPSHEEGNGKTSKSKKAHKKVTKSLSKEDLLPGAKEECDKNAMKRRSGLSNFLVTPQNVSTEAEVLNKPLATKTTYRKSFTNIMPVINEDEHGGGAGVGGVDGVPATSQSQPLTMSYESVFSLALVSESDVSTTSSSRQSTSASSPDTKKDGLYASKSLVTINKKKKRDIEQRRKMILDMEPFVTYARDQNGEIMPAVNSFKKKTFLPPSHKEKYFQKKMLAAQHDARSSQDQKIEEFYRKLDVDKDKSYFIRQRVPTPVEKYEDMGPMGASLEQVAQIFKHRHVHIPEGVDPESIEAMQYCQYIRTHDFDSPRRRGKRSQHNVF